VLGSAAGGGLPQWNCACDGCTAARNGEIPQRTQASLAVSEGGGGWQLINASPDLRQQLLSLPEFSPASGSGRQTPVRDVLLTSADLDHVLGCLLMREADQPLRIHASPPTQMALSWMHQLLQPFAGVSWRATSTEFAPFMPQNSDRSCLEYRSLNLSAAKGIKDACAFVLRDCRTNRKLLVAPDMPAVTNELLHEMGEAEAIFWDGTFWDDGELTRLAPGKKRARQMGHLPLNEGSLEALAASPARIKVLIHINNTNPILLPHSTERAQVESAGVIIAEDGMSFSL
jgi:pyrroloquinoline quinone biosynthesis protein B